MKITVSLLVLAILALRTASADEVVLFSDGRALKVQGWSVVEGLATLDLVEGGRIWIPAEQVIGVEILTESPAAEEEIPVRQIEALAESLRGEDRWREAAGRYGDQVAAAADRHGLDRSFLAAVVKTESNFDPYAVSPKGACGLLQLMPETARRFSVSNVFDVQQNLEGGARYLSWLLERFGGRIDLALAGYNAGEKAVDRHGGVPPYLETVQYVTRVLRRVNASRNR